MVRKIGEDFTNHEWILLRSASGCGYAALRPLAAIFLLCPFAVYRRTGVIAARRTAHSKSYTTTFVQSALHLSTNSKCIG
jgi:hypothetical protein